MTSHVTSSWILMRHLADWEIVSVLLLLFFGIYVGCRMIAGQRKR